MTVLLVGLLVVSLAPLFVTARHAAVLALAAQGMILAGVATQVHGHPGDLPDPGHAAMSTAGWLTLADLVLVRGLLAPLALLSVLRLQRSGGRSELLPPNMLCWTAALATIPVAFSLSDCLVVTPGPRQLLTAVTAALVLLGFLVLSTASSPLNQMIGALYVENAVALLELGGGHHPELPVVQLGQMVVTISTLALFRWYLEMLARPGLVAGEGAEAVRP